MSAHEHFIRRVNDIALDARARGNKPFGALLALDGKIILTAENTFFTGNPLGHAELNLLLKAWNELSREQIERATLYASTEPCAMCAGAIYWSGIRRVVFSFSGAEFGKLVGAQLCEPCGSVINSGAVKSEILGPILEEEGRKPHEGFWQNLQHPA